MQIYRRGFGPPAHALQQRAYLSKLLRGNVAGVFLSHASILGLQREIVDTFLNTFISRQRDRTDLLGDFVFLRAVAKAQNGALIRYPAKLI